VTFFHRNIAVRTLQHTLSVSISTEKEEGRMDALALLKEDHKTVKTLFEKAEETEDQKKKEEIFEDIKTELETHARIEETVFYPAMEKHQELKDMVLEAIEEHKQVKTLLREIDNLKSDSEKFEPKLKVLMENVEHHAEEEEEGKMFPKVREIVDRKALEELGQELEKAKG
jgi:hemerythrin superfamily protein